MASAFIDAYLKQCAEFGSSSCTMAFIDMPSFAALEGLLRTFAETWTARLQANNALSSEFTFTVLELSGACATFRTFGQSACDKDLSLWQEALSQHGR